MVGIVVVAALVLAGVSILVFIKSKSVVILKQIVTGCCETVHSIVTHVCYSLFTHLFYLLVNVYLHEYPHLNSKIDKTESTCSTVTANATKVSTCCCIA